MKSFRERRAWLVGIVSIVLIAGAVAFAFSLNNFEVLRGVYTIKADLKDAAGLQPGNEVRVAGVKVGRVTEIDLTADAARISMEVARDVRLPVETRVEVKLRTILGQKFVDLKIPEAFVTAASGGGDPSGLTRGFLNPGDVIPKSQTKVPYEVYLAATQGTAALEQIDKRALRKMIQALGQTIGASKEELRALLADLDVASGVLAEKGPEITKLLRNTQRVAGTLADSDQDIDGILREATDVFGVLAERRETTSTLLASTEALADNLGLLIQGSRSSVQLSVTSLDGILVTAEAELKTIQRSLDELAVAQRMFGQPAKFGRFLEGHVCAITSEDTCVPEGSPEDPGIPVEGQQPTSFAHIQHGRGLE
jgi:phospholipid/cholesterol/gamma-HCH transport system substrate-binding protein